MSICYHTLLYDIKFLRSDGIPSLYGHDLTRSQVIAWGITLLEEPEPSVYCDLIITNQKTGEKYSYVDFRGMEPDSKDA